MGLILWLIFGALAGWLASLINGTNREQGWIGARGRDGERGELGQLRLPKRKLARGDFLKAKNVWRCVAQHLGAEFFAFIPGRDTRWRQKIR